MSSLGSPNPFFLAGKKAYEVERSLRFNDNDNAHLSRTPSSAGNRKVWTWSAWIKRANIGLGSNANMFHAYDGSSSNRGVISFNTSDQLKVDQGGGSGSSRGQALTTRVFRDSSAWYHIVCVANYSDSTASDRLKVYVNGVQQTLTFNVGYFDEDGQINGTFEHEIGVSGNSNSPFDGYMAEYNFIDGSALTPASFGATDAITGQWNPKKYVGSYGTNGFYLNFSDNSGTTATTLGKDSSGNGNNFTPNNFNTHDSLIDTPTNNFCILNSAFNHHNRGELVLYEGGLKGDNGGGGDDLCHGTFGIKSGKWYFEATGSSVQTQSHFVGVQTSDAPEIQGGMYRNNGYIVNYSGTLTTGNGTYDSGDVMGVAIDADAGKVYFAKNNTYINSGNPSTGANASFTYTPSSTDHILPALMFDNISHTCIWYINFGQDSSFAGFKTAQGNTDSGGKGDFYYAPPSGFLALCSANLPEPTIAFPNQHFDTLTWSGNSTKDTNITGLNFQPDWVWIKSRSHSVYSGNLKYNHVVWDALRGVGLDTSASSSRKELTINEIYPEGSAINLSNYYGHVSAFNSDGFTLDHITGQPAFLTNQTGRTYVGWNWNAGGTTVTNNDGTISSQVRANTTAGFSIITYTGTGSAGATVGHGLGVTPDVIIIKNRTDGSSSFWAVYHKAAFNNASDPNILYLNEDDAQSDDTNVFGTSVTIDSSKFSLGNYNGSNGNGDNMVAYCFSEVAGYSKFGSYRGNGNANGTFVFTGFRPAWIMIKCSSSTFNWIIYDSKREPFNLIDKYLMANSANAEAGSSTDNPIDFLSNGFKLRYTNTSTNQNGGTFIYFAFAESPFKNARAR